MSDPLPDLDPPLPDLNPPLPDLNPPLPDLDPPLPDLNPPLPDLNPAIPDPTPAIPGRGSTADPSAYPGLAAALRVAHRQDGAIGTTQARDAGLSPGQLAQLVRSDRWRRPWRGAYLVPGAHPVRGRIRAALLGRPDAVVCDLSAARLLRFDGLPPEGRDEPVHLRLPTRRARAQPRGLVLHWGEICVEDIVTVAGIPTTSPARTLADLVLRRGRYEAVALMDAALRTGHLDDLRRARTLTTRRAGAASRHDWWELADGRAESVLETWLRLTLSDAGLPAAQVQWPVRDGEGRFARLDLAYPSQRVDVEADGVTVHDRPGAVYRDRWRQNLLANLGWTVLRFTWADLLHRPRYVAQTVRSALSVAR
jgi:very-short-patch-repair endonuclease